MSSKKSIAKLLKPYKAGLAKRGLSLTEGAILSDISKAKAKGLSPKDLLDRIAEIRSKSDKKGKGKAHHGIPVDESVADDDDVFAGENPKVITDEITAKIYEQYQRILQENNSLDFDDLLIYGVRLFKSHNHVSKWCHHILVDELSVPSLDKSL